MKSLLCILSFYVITNAALAGSDMRVNISVTSKHLDARPLNTHTEIMLDQNGNFLYSETNEVPTPDYNETNPGLGVEIPFLSGNYWMLGAYKNSYYETSIYAGVGREFYKTNNFKIVVETFIVSGYEGGLKFGATPGIVVGSKEKGFKLNYVPSKSIGGGDSDFITFQYQFEY